MLVGWLEFHCQINYFTILFVAKGFQSLSDPAMLLEYSIIMTSSDTFNKGENGSAW